MQDTSRHASELVYDVVPVQMNDFTLSGQSRSHSRRATKMRGGIIMATAEKKDALGDVTHSFKVPTK